MKNLSKENDAMKTQIASLIENKRLYSSVVTASKTVTFAMPLHWCYAASVVESDSNGLSTDPKSINAIIDKRER